MRKTRTLVLQEWRSTWPPGGPASLLSSSSGRPLPGRGILAASWVSPRRRSSHLRGRDRCNGPRSTWEIQASSVGRPDTPDLAGAGRSLTVSSRQGPARVERPRRMSRWPLRGRCSPSCGADPGRATAPATTLRLNARLTLMRVRACWPVRAIPAWVCRAWRRTDKRPEEGAQGLVDRVGGCRRAGRACVVVERTSASQGCG